MTRLYKWKWSNFFQDGATALMFASQNGHGKVVETLLKEGSDPNLKTKV